MTALVARVLSRGLQGVPAFIAGFVAGALLWFTVAATGMAVLAASFAAVFAAIRYAGAAYLLYIAWKLWAGPGRAMSTPHAATDGPGRLFLTGLAINLGNPKVIAFFLALLPTVVDLGALKPLGFAELFLIVATIASGVLTAYAMSAAYARRVSRRRGPSAWSTGAAAPSWWEPPSPLRRGRHLQAQAHSSHAASLFSIV